MLRGPTPFSAPQVAKMESGLPPPSGQVRLELRVRYVHIAVMSGEGQLFPRRQRPRRCAGNS